MVEVFNSLNIKVSCLGNHDTDFGLKRTMELIEMTQPTRWLMSNLTIEETGRPVAELATWTTEEVVVDQTGTKVKIGFIGIAE